MNRRSSEDRGWRSYAIFVYLGYSIKHVRSNRAVCKGMRSMVRRQRKAALQINEATTRKSEDEAGLVRTQP